MELETNDRLNLHWGQTEILEGYFRPVPMVQISSRNKPAFILGMPGDKKFM
eukprot:c31371_g1_i1 orf=154-306(+)